MQELLEKYLNYLLIERGVAQNTLEAYGRDLRRFALIAREKGFTDARQVVPEVVIEYLVRIKDEGLSANSMNRSLAAIRGFYKYLLHEKIVEQTPLANIELAKVWMRLPDTISKEEMNLILAQPGVETAATLRNSAMLELLYATGIRVSELIGLTMNSINWQVGFLVVMGKGNKERIVPIGKTAYDCTKLYVEQSRPQLMQGKSTDVLFLNRFGEEFIGYLELCFFFIKFVFQNIKILQLLIKTQLFDPCFFFCTVKDILLKSYGFCYFKSK